MSSDSKPAGEVNRMLMGPAMLTERTHARRLRRTGPAGVTRAMRLVGAVFALAVFLIASGCPSPFEEGASCIWGAADLAFEIRAQARRTPTMTLDGLLQEVAAEHGPEVGVCPVCGEAYRICSDIDKWRNWDQYADDIAVICETTHKYGVGPKVHVGVDFQLRRVEIDAKEYERVTSAGFIQWTGDSDPDGAPRPAQKHSTSAPVSSR